jgi:hypothetical protein
LTLLGVSLLFPPLAAFLALSVPGKDGQVPVSSLPSRIFLSVGLGLGVASAFYYLWALAVRPSNRLYVAVELVTITALGFGFFLLRRKRRGEVREAGGSGPGSGDWLLWVAAGGFAVACALALGELLFASSVRPHGDWDAWQTWNSRGRLLFLGGERWMDFLRRAQADYNPNYPLLLPGIVARGWLYLGGESQAGPVAAAILFTAATVVLLADSATLSGGRLAGPLAGAMLLGTTYFVQRGASQYADVPLSFYYLATLALVYRYESGGGRSPALLVLAGAMAGLAGWTKNEGVLFIAVAGLVWIALCLLPFRGWRESARSLAPFLAGLLPFLALILLHKKLIAQPDYWLSRQGEASIRSWLLDPSRYRMILAAYGNDFLSRFPVVLPVGLLAFFGIRRGILRDRGWRFGALVMTLMLAGYFGVFLTSPWDLQWLLANTQSRTTLQLWPGILLVAALAAKVPDPRVPGGSKKGFAREGSVSPGRRRAG